MIQSLKTYLRPYVVFAALANLAALYLLLSSAQTGSFAQIPGLLAIVLSGIAVFVALAIKQALLLKIGAWVLSGGIIAVLIPYLTMPVAVLVLFYALALYSIIIAILITRDQNPFSTQT
jgi:hypothetical protein